MVCFVKVAAEEKAIRTDPAARVTLLVYKRVFGQLDKKLVVKLSIAQKTLPNLNDPKNLMV